MSDSTFSLAERRVLTGVSPRGTRLEDGQPCTCGPEHYVTRREDAFGETEYRHRCTECDNEFVTV